MSIKGQSIKINDLKFNVAIEGKGLPVILLHGFPDSAYVWREQIKALSQKGYQVIAPDLRGMGDSEAPQERKQYGVDIICSDVVALMDYLGIEKAPVIGHDWGAVTGWVFTGKYPERVKCYVALSVAHPKAYRSNLEQLLRGWYTVLFQFPYIAEGIIRAFDWFPVHKMTNNHPEAGHWIEDLNRKGRLSAALNWYRANEIHMLLGDFPKIKVPVLGIWSTGDIFLCEKPMLLSARYVDAPWSYERIEGAGHWIPLDAPKRLNNILIDYLTRKNPGQSAESANA
ncbi:MAG: alpha/beta hydrolase [Syntrophaceae bacterium]|nr:alpha/beta hydrolase [Syntrophaceae bacterium]